MTLKVPFYIACSDFLMATAIFPQVVSIVTIIIYIYIIYNFKKDTKIKI